MFFVSVGKTLFPKIIVMGALGRCGCGSVEFLLEKFGIPRFEYFTRKLSKIYIIFVVVGNQFSSTKVLL